MSNGSLASFTADLNRFAKTIDSNVELVLKRVALQVLRGVVQKTPVDTGRAMASWLVGVNKVPADSEAPGDLSNAPLSAEAASRIALEGSVEIQQASEYSVIYIINPLPYIFRLENGHSGQAPNGMVAVTLGEVEADLVRVLRSI